MWHAYLTVEFAGLLIALVAGLVISLRIGAWRKP
jgi:hypothetical protein